MAAFPADWELPEYRAQVLRPKKTRFCLCIPVLNEGERIARELGRLAPMAPQIDIVIADGGSADGALPAETLRSAGVRALLVKTGPGRLSAQLRMGLAYAMAEGYEGVVLIDGNDKDDPAAVPEFIAALEAGYDHLQGSRFIAGGRALRTPAARWLGIRLVHAPLISLAAGFGYTDTTNGFRAYSRRLLLDPRVAPFRNIFSGYELHYYLAIKAPRLGYKTKEIPVTRAYPEGGKVPTKIAGLAGNWDVLKTLARACLNRFDPPPGGPP